MAGGVREGRRSGPRVRGITGFLETANGCFSPWNYKGDFQQNFRSQCSFLKSGIHVKECSFKK